MNALGIIIWSVALAALLFYVVRLTLGEPKGERLPLCTYWLLFVFSPLAIFAFIVAFSPMALIFGFVMLIILVLVGERGVRVWSRLFKSSQ
jgi:hypothetical protein